MVRPPSAREGAGAAGTLTNLAAALAIVPRHEDREAVGGEQLERADRLEVRRRGATLSG